MTAPAAEEGSRVGWLHAMIDLPPGAAAAAGFWESALGWPLGSPWPGHAEFASFRPPSGDAYVHRQLGDHGPRIHLDLEVDDPDARWRSLIGLGARPVGRFPDWLALASPGGLPFCLVRARPHVSPGPLQWSGHRSRLVQVCIDSPADRHRAEVDFWRQATGWAWSPGDAPEFAGKLRGPQSPIQLLFQRLGDDDPGRTTRAHLDLGSDDIGADAERLRALGAAVIGPGDGWIALRDPAGLAFCTTRTPPD